jgi:hypothetical protein
LQVSSRDGHRGSKGPGMNSAQGGLGLAQGAGMATRHHAGRTRPSPAIHPHQQLRDSRSYDSPGHSARMRRTIAMIWSPRLRPAKPFRSAGSPVPGPKASATVGRTRLHPALINGWLAGPLLASVTPNAPPGSVPTAGKPPPLFFSLSGAQSLVDRHSHYNKTQGVPPLPVCPPCAPVVGPVWCAPG